MKQKGLLWLIIVCVLVGITSYMSTLYVVKKNTEILPIAQAAQKPPEKTEPKETENIKNVSVTTEPRIQPSTKMVYKYYYAEDDVTKEHADVPPYFILGLTMDELQKMYEDWVVLSFSEQEVVMRRMMTGKSDERYIVSQKDGYIAVFYEEEQNGVSLHEVTDTPMASLPQEDQDRLKEGISVLGDDNLSKILSDYGS